MKAYFEYLLSDESKGIILEDYLERKNIVTELENQIDNDALGKIRHFQPQIGCLNACSICSKHASTNVAWWNERRIRNVVAAIKYVSLKNRKEKPYISWNRDNHRSGVIFSYLDNDIGNYYYLYEFINLMYDELGVSTRISTVGYSRHNDVLNSMHEKINTEECLEKLAGFRISFTPYAIGWKCNNKDYSRQDYIMDMSNILKIYKPYYEFAGSGSRKMCVELRYKPLVILDKVFEEVINGHIVIACNHHVYVSKEPNATLKTSFISDPYEHTIALSEESVEFYDMLVHGKITSYKELNDIVVSSFAVSDEYKKSVSLYKMENSDGYYYSIEPSITEEGNYGVNIYPITGNRINSGLVITERFALNAILAVKQEHNLKSLEKFDNATWQDVYKVLDNLSVMAERYKKNSEIEKAEYIVSEVLPSLDGYVSALQQAGYKASDFFDADFSIDTGIICNLGAALREFKGITFLENEPLTPTHERNYGRHNSTMTREMDVFRISCEYDNKLLIQRLNLSKTATREGQVEFSKSITLNQMDETYTIGDLKDKYLVPGQRRKS